MRPLRSNPVFGVAILFGVLLLAGSPVAADDFRRLEGHGGPVKGIAALGERVLTASFDYAVGVWDLSEAEAPPVWLDGHRAAVNAVAFLPGNRAVSAGDDFDLILWDLSAGTPIRTMPGHQGKVVSLSVSPDGTQIASASWDGRAGLWDVASGAVTWLDGPGGGINDAVFVREGAGLLTATSDGRILDWDVADGTLRRTVARHGFGVNRIIVDEAAGWLAYGAVDGGMRVLDLATGEEIVDLTTERRPILAMSLSKDRKSLAVGDGEGFIMTVATRDWSILRDVRAARRGPVWALSWTANGSAIIAGGIDDWAAVWPVGAAPDPFGVAERSFLRDPDEMPNGERQFARKCSICHTLGPEGARRAGPSLHGIFGRPAGTLAGYAYSPALLDTGIVWDGDSIGQLFEDGPDVMTPGSKMPMQVIAAEEDRADLIAYLRKATDPVAHAAQLKDRETKP